MTVRVPPSYQVLASQSGINIDEDVGSRCEGGEEPLVALLRGQNKIHKHERLYKSKCLGNL